ncbi:hypothetical protein [Caenimonas sp. SL110]|uniref:hypothetical protein n=1 Tax=Caenimonas sp. SL110 TaxID=1450524 RepID=UPI0006534E39|nr:hypothetical protein [Caenimonas sp. SL110]
MSKFSKLAGLIAGVSTVAVFGVAIAQGQPPNPLIPHHAIAAGQQSSHITPMGETGVLTQIGEVRTATIQREAEVAYVAPAAEPVQQVAVVETTTMGAAPEPAPAAPAPMPKADRN